MTGYSRHPSGLTHLQYEVLEAVSKCGGVPYSGSISSYIWRQRKAEGVKKGVLINGKLRSILLQLFDKGYLSRSVGRHPTMERDVHTFFCTEKAKSILPTSETVPS